MRILSNTLHCSHREKFSLLCKDAEELVIASPFCFPDFSGFADMIKNVDSISKVIFITTAKNNEIAGKIDSLLSFRNEMERIGVQWQLRFDNYLHGKKYIFKKDGVPFSGIITSANLTHKGMVMNHEWGVQIDDLQVLKEVESQIVVDAPSVLTSTLLDEIKDKVNATFPSGVQMPEPIAVNIDDILHTYQVAKDTRIFIKPIGSSENHAREADYSKERMYFSRKPASVCIGDIMIAYGVGIRKIIGAFKITSEKGQPNKDSRWKWYMEAECLTPNLSNKVWYSIWLLIMSESTQYATKYGKFVTMNDNENLNGLKIHNDKIQLTKEFGKCLFNKVMSQENNLNYV